MKLLEVQINDYGGAPVADHNMPCAVCQTEPAMLDLNSGVFHPCWMCQRSDHDLVRWSVFCPRWLRSWLTTPVRLIRREREVSDDRHTS